MSKFIVLEGIDGSGKTTNAKALAAASQPEMQFQHVPSPSYGAYGSLIRKMLSGDIEVLEPFPRQMLFAVDRFVVAREVKALLDSGIYVIGDRWWYSSVIYGALDGLDVERTKALYASLPVRPDMVVHLIVDPKISVEREGKTSASQDLYDGDLKRQSVLAEIYDAMLAPLALSEMGRARYRDGKDRYFFNVNASVAQEQVQNELRRIIDDRFRWTPRIAVL